VGKSIILRTGPLKGYQGIVKSINKDKIEVRVLSKACTEWVPRENVTTKQEAMEVGKTPNRRGGNTHAYAPSPSRY
jgi:transcription elongation factor